MIFVIGDIHGELAKLKSLITVLSAFQIEKLIFVGDYIDKGPESKETLDFLIQLSERIPCVFLEGDHERAWLTKNITFLQKYGGHKTLDTFGLKDFNASLIDSKILTTYSEFFSHLKKTEIVGNYKIIHTGPGTRYDFLQSTPKNHQYITIFGHTAFHAPYVDPYKIGIDTGAAYYKAAPLTAFELTENFFINHYGEKKSLASIAFDRCPTIIRHHDTW